MSIKIFFVRHGESEKNVQKMHSCSREKSPLTDKGQAEVDEAAKGFKGKVDLIITSPILRARQTAEIFNQYLKVPVIQNEYLAEIDCGVWNDVPREKLKIDSADYQNYRQLSHAEKIKYKMGGHGESREDVIQRAKQFVRELLIDHNEKSILVVAHGCTYSALEKILHGCEPDEYFKHEDIGHNDIREFTLENNFKI